MRIFWQKQSKIKCFTNHDLKWNSSDCSFVNSVFLIKVKMIVRFRNYYVVPVRSIHFFNLIYFFVHCFHVQILDMIKSNYSQKLGIDIWRMEDCSLLFLAIYVTRFSSILYQFTVLIYLWKQINITIHTS